MRHIVDKKEITRWGFSQELAGSYGPDSHKTLKVVCDFLNKEVWFEVYNQRAFVFSNSSIDEAINKYNELP